MQEEIANSPPRFAYLIARHDVPYGKVFRMWDTRGRLYGYVNRGEVHDLPAAKHGQTSVHGLESIAKPGFFGIPVFLE